MFKKIKNSLDKEIALELDEQESFRNPFGADFTHAAAARERHFYEQEEEPETVIAPHVEIKGSLSFQRLLRIDGTFEGELHSTGKLIIGPTGQVTAHLDLEEAFIAGKVVGNITVKKRLVLRGKAEVIGDITAPLLSVDEGVSIIGILNVAGPAHSSESQEETAANANIAVGNPS